MKHSTGRFLTTHAGSLPRTDALGTLLLAQSRGEAPDAEAFSAAVEDSTRQAIEGQVQAGIDIGNSGEQSRISFSSYVTLRMTGFGGRGQRRKHKDLMELGILHPTEARSEAVKLMSPPKCIGPVKYERLDEAQKECDDLLRIAQEHGAPFQEAFMTAASPGVIAVTMLNDYYPSYEEYLFVLAEEMRKEYELIVSKGFVLQLDCPDLAMEHHISYQDEPLSAFLELVALNVRALNQAIRNIPPDRVRLHACWGNYEGPHHYDVPMADILPLLYQANVGALVLEMANPRHAHEYKLFQRYPLPNDMLLVAGVIDSKSRYIEHPEVVADRILRVVQAVGDPPRIIAGTDCGFDTAAGAGRVERQIVWEKLKALSQGAALASQAVSW